VPFCATGIASGDKARQRQALSTGVDLVVCTPGRLRKMHARGEVFYSHVHTVVLDEADTLIEDFGQEVAPTLRSLASKQLVLVGATVTPALRKTLKDKFEELEILSAASLHRPPERLKHAFEKSRGADKITLLTTLLEQAGGKTLVFCNTIQSARAVEHAMREIGVNTACLHGGMPQANRAEAWSSFNNNKAKVLVCTDLASRGLDTLAVSHVINFDFPSSATEYIHRSGRTARAGAKGLVTSIITKHDTKLASLIQADLGGKRDLQHLSALKSRPHNVNAAKSVPRAHYAQQKASQPSTRQGRQGGTPRKGAAQKQGEATEIPEAKMLGPKRKAKRSGVIKQKERRSRPGVFQQAL